MSEEDAFLRKLLEQPSNDLIRLVYADWLEEQCTPEATAKAEFLIHEPVGGVPPSKLERPTPLGGSS